MKFKLEIDLDNAAFSVDDDEAQNAGWRDGQMIAVVLKHIAQRLDDLGSVGDMRAPVRDFNGNTCGHWQITEEN